MMTDLKSFFAGAAPFIAAFDAWVPAGLEAVADHICYKCASAEEYERVRALFEREGRFIYQTTISERRIATIGFEPALATVLGPIRFLELSDQKPDGSQTSGFDHIEIYPTAGSKDALAAKLEAGGTAFEKVVRPHHTTYDARIFGAFKVRLEDEPLIDKIKNEELT